MVRLHRSWRMICLLACKGAALSLVALVLLLAFSTAEEFHTYTLHKGSSPSRPLQIGSFTTNARLVQGPGLACSWQSLIATASNGSPVGIQLRPLFALRLDQPTGDR